MNKNILTPDFIVDTTLKENAYLLGFLWADGWITNSKHTHSISMYIIKEDFEKIEPLLRKFGVYCFYDRQRQRNGKNFGKISRGVVLQNKSIVEFLIKNDYDKKSGCSPSKILSLIPTDIKHYFWRGYVDGDGCISAQLRKREVALWSVENQDWSCTISLAEKLNITYQIYKYSRRNGKHRSSVFRIGCINDIVKFCDYIYQNYDGMGLSRKYNKYQQVKILQQNSHKKTSKYVGVFLCSRSGKWGANIYNPSTKKQKHLGWFSTEQDAFVAKQAFTESPSPYQDVLSPQH